MTKSCRRAASTKPQSPPAIPKRSSRPTPPKRVYQLMGDIELLEGMLAVARRDYNDSVLAYNTSVLKFPRVLYASMFGFARSYEYWKMNDGADEIPVVDFE